MRKSNVLALAIVVALIAVAILAWTFLSRPASPSGSERVEKVEEAESPTRPERAAELETPATSSRSDVGALHERAATTASATSLRVDVRYASGLDEQHDGLEVGIANRLGVLFQPRHVATNAFVLEDAPPDIYLVSAKAPGFRTAVERTTLAPKSTDAKVTITLQKERSVLVRWRGDDGRPITECVASEKLKDEISLLEIFVTKFQPSDGARPPARGALWILSRKLVVDEDASGKLTARDANVWIAREIPDPKRGPDAFGVVSPGEDGRLWASAYYCGAWLASLPIEPNQTEVEFVTPIGDLERRGGTLKLLVVDDATGRAIEGAKLKVHVDSIEASAASGIDGQLTATLVPPGRGVGELEAEDHAEIAISFTMRDGETVDLGIVRMEAAAPEACFRIVDENGAPAAGVYFELVAADGITIGATSGPTLPNDSAATSNIRFGAVQRTRCVLRCRDLSLDAAARAVEASELRSPGNTTPIATIVVRPANIASFVLDPPIAKGTQVVIESTAGHPLRELDVDEFGIAATGILAGDYRLHLVEYGRATGSVDVRVDTNPFMFEIHR